MLLYDCNMGWTDERVEHVLYANVPTQSKITGLSLCACERIHAAEVIKQK